MWAVASRHNPARDATGPWPKTLMDYCPDYRSGRGRTSRPETLCAQLRETSIMTEGCSPLTEIVDLFSTGLVDLLRLVAIRDATGHLVGKRNLWNVIASRDSQLPMRLRRLLRDKVLFGNAVWDLAGWVRFCDELTAMLGINRPFAQATTAFLGFVQEGAVAQGGQARQRSRTVFVHDDIPIHLGSIHSVKGATVDSILVLETEVWRGRARDMRVMDVGTVLPHALAIENRDFTDNIAQLAAATNVFVATTRPRQLLAFALRKEAAPENVLIAARNQGWQILDTTVVVPNAP